MSAPAKAATDLSAGHSPGRRQWSALQLTLALGSAGKNENAKASNLGHPFTALARPGCVSLCCRPFPTEQHLAH